MESSGAANCAHTVNAVFPMISARKKLEMDHRPLLPKVAFVALSGLPALTLAALTPGDEVRVPRNAPGLFFLGAREFSSVFHDGRVEVDVHRNWESGFWTPAREQLPAGLDNVLAAQAMFPVTSALEMAGHKGENSVATAAALDELDGADGVWGLLAGRLRSIPAIAANSTRTSRTMPSPCPSWGPGRTTVWISRTGRLRDILDALRI